MESKKAKDLLAKQAEQEGIPEQHLQVMVNAYWRDVTTALGDLKHIRVSVIGIGKFTIIYKRLKAVIAEKEKILSKLHGTAHIHLLTAMVRLYEIKEMWDDEITYERDFKAKKRIDKELVKGMRYEPKRKTTEGLGEQKPDS